MPGAGLRILHLASLARSGETLALRCFAAHPDVHVVHDLHDHNTADETRLFQLLRVWPGHSIPRAAAPEAGDKSVLLVKQGVFAPRHAWAGFALLRNPYAAFCSLWSYDAKLAGRVPTAEINLANWRRLRLPRLIVWADATVPWLTPVLRAQTDPVEQFLTFWRARVRQILAAEQPVVHYEDLVADPRAVLVPLCRALALPFDEAMLRSHERYASGTRGHGGIRLDAPIRPAPAWTPDPLVAIDPFVGAADELARYRGLYASRVTS